MWDSVVEVHKIKQLLFRVLRKKEKLQHTKNIKKSSIKVWVIVRDVEKGLENLRHF